MFLCYFLWLRFTDAAQMRGIAFCDPLIFCHLLEINRLKRPRETKTNTLVLFPCHFNKGLDYFTPGINISITKPLRIYDPVFIHPELYLWWAAQRAFKVAQLECVHWPMSTSMRELRQPIGAQARNHVTIVFLMSDVVLTSFVRDSVKLRYLLLVLWTWSPIRLRS